MTQRNTASVHIEFIFVDTQSFRTCNALRSESLVDFEKIDVFNGKPRLFQRFLRRTDWSDTHNFRTDTGSRNGFNTRQNRNTQFFRLFFRHQNHTGSRVVHTGSISRSHSAVFLECRLQFCQFFKTCVSARIFIRVYNSLTFPALYSNRNNFIFKFAGIDGSHCSLLRTKSVSIHFFSGHIVFIRNIFSSDTHSRSYAQVGQGIPHRISHFHMSVLLTKTGVEHHMRRSAHTVRTACHNAVCFSCFNLIIPHLYR